MSVIGNTMFPLRASFSQISKLQSRFATLQVQLATGQKATNLAELGSDRYFDLSVRNRLAKLDGYQANIATSQLRFSMLDKTMTRLDTIEGDARTAAVPSAYGTSNINFGAVPTQARSRLDEVMNLLNTDVDGRYLFGGSTTDVKPVVDANTAIDGVAGKAGFRTVVGERKAADLGASGLGRVSMTTALDTTTLAEDGAHPFGFKLSTLTSSSAGVTLTPPAGPAPQSLSVKFNSLPLAGDKITIGLSLPDASEEGITLTAVSGAPGAGEYQIGADPDATAANFGAALTASLGDMATTKLASASTFAAADNFFNGHGDPVLRVDGPPFDTATALVTADPTKTVIWYRGEDNAAPRQTVGAKVDDNTSVNYGVQANESGLLQLVKSLAAMSVETYTNADTTSKARFDAMATRNISRLAESHNNEPGSIEMIAVELGTAEATTANIAERHTAYIGQLQNMLENIESVPKEDVAMELLAIQTRLQASYQTTSLVSQLSLVNFLK